MGELAYFASVLGFFFFTPINKIDFLLLNLDDLTSVVCAPGIRD